jgi:hypothetical protein
MTRNAFQKYERPFFLLKAHLKATIYLIDLFPVVLMEETMNATESKMEEVLSKAEFRKRYVSLFINKYYAYAF